MIGLSSALVGALLFNTQAKKKPGYVQYNHIIAQHATLQHNRSLTLKRIYIIITNAAFVMYILFQRRNHHKMTTSYPLK